MGNIDGKIVETIDIGGLQITSVKEPTGDVQHGAVVSIPAATSGTVTTWTDANTGEITASGHAITTGDKVLVHWLSGSTRVWRANMDATVTGDVIAVDLGNGDDLPDVDTEVTIATMVEIEVACHPAGIDAWAMMLDQEGVASTYDFDGTIDETLELQDGEAYIFDATYHTSAFAATTGWIYVGNASTTAGTFRSGFLGDAT